MRMQLTALSIGIMVLALACQQASDPTSTVAVALHVSPSGLDGPFIVNVGTDLLLAAVPVAADSTRLGPAVLATWTSSDTVIATVAADGRVHTRCSGTALVTATAITAGRTLRGARAVLVETSGLRCA
jgi:hypothetical protein